ncbi:MAG: hypothetical protein ACR2NM_00265 [Bythopirellula sp.]
MAPPIGSMLYNGASQAVQMPPQQLPPATQQLPPAQQPPAQFPQPQVFAVQQPGLNAPQRCIRPMQSEMGEQPQRQA